MRKTRVALLAVLLGTSIIGGGMAQTETATAKGKPVFGTWGFDLAGMDRSVRPGDDFFRYANGTWFDHAVIPPDRTMTGSFLDLDIQSEQRLLALVHDLEASKGPLTEDERKVRDLYHSYVDTDRIEELGLAPVEPALKAIAAAATHDDIARLMAKVSLGAESVFNTRIGVDDKNSDAYAVFIRQSGLGLPDRDYYLIDEKGTVAARNAYHAYIGEILKLGNVDNAEARADAIFRLETEIAKIHWTRAERRDADKTYNPMPVSELVAMAPDFPWTVYLAERGIREHDGAERRIVIGEKSAFPQLAKLFRETPVDVWKDYLVFHYLSDRAVYLPKRFDDARFAFYGKVLGGQSEQLSRDKRAIRFVSGVMGEGLGRLYVARYFSPEAKAKANELVRNILDVYRQRIETAGWMSAETRAKALEKVARFTVKIGYPDKWRDYSALEVRPDDVLGNQARFAEFEWNRRLKRLDMPVDKSEWGMSPQTVNAYYESSFNEIVFPAAILQPPFFDPNADDAVNYGAIGAVIGHEISHGFDDQGSKYDAKGILANWWTASDRQNFESRTNALVNQYNTYSPVEGLTVNGRLTLGENIADLAGLTVAEAAYHLSLKGKEPPVIDGFTGDQRLFLGYAQVWRFKAQDATARQRVLTDPHSPPKFRINGVVRNVDAWYDAMAVAPDEKLYLPPENRVHLW